MSEYGDEGYIYSMTHNQNLPEHEGNDIRNGYADVGERYVPFGERCIIENRLYMTIPAEFEPLSSTLIKIAYPYENSSDVVFAAEKEAKSVNFWVNNTPPDSAETEAVLEHILGNVNPEHKIINTILACTFFAHEQEGFEDMRIGWFELVTDDGGKEISDLVFFFPMDGKFIIGSFKCISVEMPEWEDVVVQMLHTIRVV
jgi:hypothetical protein